MIRVIENLSEFVVECVPEGTMVRCRVTRSRKGVDRGIYPTYFLHLEREEGRPVFLLAARKRKKVAASSYLISTDPTDLSRECQSLVGRLTANILGAKFCLMAQLPAGSRLSAAAHINDHHHHHMLEDSTSSSRTSDRSSSASSSDASEAKQQLREICLAQVQYDLDILGMKGPRNMNVLAARPADNVYEVLKSKKAAWDSRLKSYVLDFHGRASQASVKNFQLVRESQPDVVIMQFGKLSEEKFILDFRHPLSALQAFGIALSSFDCKIACE